MGGAHGPAEERLANDPASELWGEHLSRYRFAARGLAGQVVADIACGSGFGLAVLRDAGARVVGLDYDAGALRTARGLAAGTPLARADATRLPLRDDSLDAVVSFETIEHVPDADAMLAEMRRVLRPGGRLVLSTPNRLFGPAWRHTGNPFHVREFSGEELYDLLLAYFEHVTLYGQWVDSHYRYVPFLMVERDLSPQATLWKLQNRLPAVLREGIARALDRRPFYPTEHDYQFIPRAWAGAHALLAEARGPRRP